MKYISSALSAIALLALATFAVWTGSVARPVVAQTLSPEVIRAITASVSSTNANASTTYSTGSKNVKFIGEIYTKEDVPHWWNSQITPFLNAVWLPGGYFAVAGSCSPAVQAPEVVSSKGAGNNIGIQGGLEVFKEDGTFVGKRNVCYDGDIPGSGNPDRTPLYCNEGAACEGSTKLIPLSGSTFVREMIATNIYGKNRPPLEYKINSSNVSLIDKAYDGNLKWNYPKSEGGATPLIGNLVRVGDKLLGQKQKYEADGRQYAESNVLLSQSFSILREWSVPTSTPAPGTPGVSGTWPLTQAQVIPYAAVGDYVIGKSNTWNDTGIHVYKLDDNDKLTKVGDLPYYSGNYIAPVYDAANPDRVTFMINPDGGTIKLVTYEPDTNGIKLTREQVLSNTGGFYAAYGVPAFAVAGDYTAYRCTIGAAGGLYENSGVCVLKGETMFAQFKLPKRTMPVTDPKFQQPEQFDLPVGIALSPKGNLVVGSYWGVLYLYKVGDGINPNPGGPVTPGGPGVITATSGPGTINGIEGFLDIAKGYLFLLQTLTGGTPIGAGTTQKAAPQVPGYYETLFRQAADLVNTYGQ